MFSLRVETLGAVTEIPPNATMSVTLLVTKFGTIWGSLEVTLRTRFSGAVSASPTENTMSPEVEFWLTVWVPTVLIVGTRLTGFTVRVNWVVSINWPFATVNVIWSCPPPLLKTGVMVAVRSIPDPPRMIVPLGTTAWLSDDAVTTNESGDVVVLPGRTWNGIVMLASCLTEKFFRLNGVIVGLPGVAPEVHVEHR